jgi:hypothetical protein
LLLDSSTLRLLHSLTTLLSLFAPRAFHNSFTINRFRTLSQNCRGVTHSHNSHSGTPRAASAERTQGPASLALGAARSGATPAIAKLQESSPSWKNASMPKTKSLLHLLLAMFVSCASVCAQTTRPEPEQKLAHDIYKEFVEIQSGFTTGATTPVAEAAAARLRAAAPSSPFSFSLTSTSSKPSAKTGAWIPFN